MLKTHSYVLFSNDYKGGFGTALMTKDLGLAQDAATRAQAATPLGSLAHQVQIFFCNFTRHFVNLKQIFLDLSSYV